MPPPPPPQEEKRGKRDKKERDAAAPVAVAAEVVGRRLRVYWPLDDAWYEGRVEAYDSASGKHCVKYDDGDEEQVDLGKERFEWVAAGEECTPTPARKLRRLRRMSDTAVAKSPAVAEDEEDGAGDSTEHEDWKKSTVVEDDLEEVELSSQKAKTRNSLPVSGSAPSTLGSGSTSGSGSTISKKRKKVDVGSLECAKRFSFEAVNTSRKVDPEIRMSCGHSKQWNLNCW
jgi:DNA mismatch repair protein MSH6